jgi:hypothetical protein
VVTIGYNAYMKAHEGHLYDDFLAECGIAGLIREAQAAGVGVIAMKSQAGGGLQDIAPFSADGVSVAQAKLRWVLSNPCVTAVITEILTEQQLDEDLAIVGQLPAEAEKVALAKHVQRTWSQVCRMCGSCSSACPQGVAVTDIVRLERYCSGYGRPGLARELYAALPASCRASCCTGCGTCESACRYGVPIRERLARAHETLSA